MNRIGVCLLGSIFGLACLPLYGQVRPTADWTLLVFLNGDNDLEPAALADFREMAAVGSTDRVHVIVQFDRLPKTAPNDDNWSECLRYRITQGMKPKKSAALMNLGECNMGDGNTLLEFVQWGRGAYPARHLALIIWDHGQGWRSQQFIAVPGRGLLQPGVLRYVSSDASSIDHLYNREIQDALSRALGGQRLDLLGFDACLMGMIETAYAFREHARVFVASEELEPGEGWDYTKLLKKLTDKPDMIPSELGRTIVETYGESVAIRHPDTTLSALDLARMPYLAGAVDEFARLAMSADDELQCLIKARSRCRPYNETGQNATGVDLDLLCQRYAELSTAPSAKAIVDRVRQELAHAVLKNYAGDERKRNDDSQLDFGSAGLSIYFPESQAARDADPDRSGYTVDNTVYPVQWVGDRLWSSLLTKCFGPVQ